MGWNFRPTSTQKRIVYECPTWIWNMNCYQSNVRILPLGGKFKKWIFFKQHQFLPDVWKLIIKYYIIPTLPIIISYIPNYCIVVASKMCSTTTCVMNQTFHREKFIMVYWIIQTEFTFYKKKIMYHVIFLRGTLFAK